MATGHEEEATQSTADEPDGQTGERQAQDFPGLRELTESVKILLPLAGEAVSLGRKVRALTKRFRTAMRLVRPLVIAPFIEEDLRMGMLGMALETLIPESRAFFNKLIEYRQKANQGMEIYLSISTSDLEDLMRQDIDGTILLATAVVDVFDRTHGKLKADVDVFNELFADVQLWAAFRREQIQTRARDAARMAMNGQ
ncbi:hypothetical protein A1O7_05817 [Cladophialophora yegresii CBS 114405]|uniref:Uncharacterized protein n=1 Tax=Cladophialophora yegresii CBS 114405 TaxID=1182544 RepID=W9VRR9_9EURO|nr:uncharacterized protein A1O7_05817 [Cladophialophora yegresii CBS 114405]EXJ58392.1 hypothetical protein A1O7_05817 [Cladophialophora yegresii CBS 114405]